MPNIRPQLVLVRRPSHYKIYHVIMSCTPAVIIHSVIKSYNVSHHIQYNSVYNNVTMKKRYAQVVHLSLTSISKLSRLSSATIPAI